jgi:hypothetical protein
MCWKTCGSYHVPRRGPFDCLREGPLGAQVQENKTRSRAGCQCNTRQMSIRCILYLPWGIAPKGMLDINKIKLIHASATRGRASPRMEDKLVGVPIVLTAAFGAALSAAMLETAGRSRHIAPEVSVVSPTVNIPSKTTRRAESAWCVA